MAGYQKKAQVSESYNHKLDELYHTYTVFHLV